MPKSHIRQTALISLGKEPSSLLLVTPLFYTPVMSRLQRNMQYYSGSVTSLGVNARKSCNMCKQEVKKHIVGESPTNCLLQTDEPSNAQKKVTDKVKYFEQCLRQT